MVAEAVEAARAELAALREREAELERQIGEAERALGSSVPEPERSMTLHDVMADVLRSTGNEGMTGRELADAVNRRGRYRRRDGAPVEPNQIHARVNNYSAMFEKVGSTIRLREEDSVVPTASGGIVMFKDDDAGFHGWLDEHPDGFFVNTERKPRETYLVLHRPQCPHFDRSPTMHWTRDYIKFCSDDRQQLEAWASEAVAGEVTLCRSCFG